MQETSNNKEWPMKDIGEPEENDVMCGRGAGTNYHPGNKKYRDMVESRKEDYHIHSDRLHKKLIADKIVEQIRKQNPPGRFLEKNKKTGQWDDVGDEKAKSKTVQTLRENGPQVRKRYEERQHMMNGVCTSNESQKHKSTPLNGIKKNILKRAKSISRYANEATKKASESTKNIVGKAGEQKKKVLQRGQSVGQTMAHFLSFKTYTTTTTTRSDPPNTTFDFSSSPTERTSEPWINTSTSKSFSDSAAAIWCSGSSNNSTGRIVTPTNQDLEPIPISNETLPQPGPFRPDIIKRATSHRNESYETKPSRVKKPALNRDQSAVANRLKKQYIPECLSKDMQGLRLSTSSQDRPSPINTSNRLNMEDKVELDILKNMHGSLVSNDAPAIVSSDRPLPLDTSDRMKTCDTIELDILESLTDGKDHQLRSISVRSDTSSLLPRGAPGVVSLSSSDRPLPLNQSNRVNTYDTIELEILDGLSEKKDLSDHSPSVVSLERPTVVKSHNRMNTMENYEHDLLKRVSDASAQPLFVQKPSSVVSEEQAVSRISLSDRMNQFELDQLTQIYGKSSESSD